VDTSGVVSALVEEMVLWTQVVRCVVVLLRLSVMEPEAATSLRLTSYPSLTIIENPPRKFSFSPPQ